jgi:hypothetical protein
MTAAGCNADASTQRSGATQTQAAMQHNAATPRNAATPQFLFRDTLTHVITLAL